MTSSDSNPPSVSGEASSSGPENLWPAIQGLCGELSETEEAVFFEQLGHSSSARQELERAVLLDDCLQTVFSEQAALAAELAASASAANSTAGPSHAGVNTASRPATAPAVRVLAVAEPEPPRSGAVRTVLAIAVACLLLVCGLLLNGASVPHHFQLAADSPSRATPLPTGPSEAEALPALLWVELTLAGDGSPLLPGELEPGSAEFPGHSATGPSTFDGERGELLLSEAEGEFENESSPLDIPEWMLVAVTAVPSSATESQGNWPGELESPAEKKEQ